MYSAREVYERHMRRHTLSELIPVESYDEESGLFITSDGCLGFGFESKPLPGCDDSVAQRLNVLYSFDYPKDSFIQILLMAGQDISPSLEKIRKLRNKADKALGESMNNRLAMLKLGSVQSPSMHARAYVRDYRVIFTVKLPYDKKNAMPTPQEIGAAKELALSFEQTLKSAGFHPRQLAPQRYLRLVGQILHWGPHANWRNPEDYYDPEVPINEQLSEADDMMVVDANGIWLGEKRLRILSPVRFPGIAALHLMRRMFGDPLSGTRGVHGNFFINLNLFLPSNSDENEKANNERNATNYQVFGPMMRFNPKLQFKKESADILFDATNDGSRIVKAMLSIGIFGNSTEESETLLTEAQTYLSEINWQVKEDKYLALPMLINSLPFCADAGAVRFLQRYRRMAGVHAVEFFPVISDWSGSGTPQMTFISRGGQIMHMDMFDSSTNYNTCIVAASGSGKSFLTNDIITSYISSGAKIWVIDIGRSYEKLVNAIGGDFIEFGDKSQICINPFQIVKNYNEEADMLVGIIASMASIEDRLSDLQFAKLRSILRELWDKYHQDLTVDIIAQRFLADEDNRVRDMGFQLFAFTSSGEYGRYFNGKNNVNFTNILSCLELEELKGRSHLQQVVLLILIYQIQQEMYLGNRDQRKILIIDEAWDLLAKGNIAKFIETGYRRFRKYSGAAITITQSLNDLYGSPSGEAIAENSANLFLLFQKPETIESIRQKNRLMIGEAGYAYLRTVHTITGQYSEIFFSTGQGMGIGRLIVDKFTRLLYSTHPDDIRRIAERKARGMDTAEAIGDILMNEDTF